MSHKIDQFRVLRQARARFAAHRRRPALWSASDGTARHAAAMLSCPSNNMNAQIFEEKLVKGSFQLSEAQIVGTEGCWGVIIMAGIVLPIM